MSTFPFLTFLRSLTFGGVIGIGVFGFLFLAYPAFYSQYIRFEYMVTFGGALGAACHRGIDAILVKGILYPLGRKAEYYETLWELEQQRKRGMDEETYLHIRRSLAEQYFLNRTLNSVESQTPAKPKTKPRTRRLPRSSDDT